MKDALKKTKGEGQSGSSLLVVLLVLMAVSTLGAVAIMTSRTELQVAGNDKCHQMTFFAADGACDMTSELIEQNIDDRGFSTTTYGSGNLGIQTEDFYANTENADPNQNEPSASNWDIQVPDLGGSTVYLKVYGNTALSTGSALQIAAGYEGMGKSLSGGGAQIVYEIRSDASGPDQSAERVHLRWRHLI